MALSPEAKPLALRGTGWTTRLHYSAMVLLNVALALAAAVALTWLATRPGLRARVDLTAAGVNTLDESTRGLLDRLPDDAQIRIDVFFRPLDQPLNRLGAEVQGRMLHVLELAELHRPDRVEIEQHGLSPDPAESGEVEARLRELGVRDLNVVVISNGARKEVLNLLGDIAEIDLGNPIRHQGQYRPPSLTGFRGEEALLRGLLKVTQGATPKVLFAWGHGERDLQGEGERDLGRLRDALASDGFDPGRWVSDESGAIPSDCAVLAIIGPEDPFTAEGLDWIRAYVDAGGRLIVAPGHEQVSGPESVSALLAEYGIELGQGIVCSPVVDPATGRAYEGNFRCAGLILRGTQMAPEHPITRPLRMGDRRVHVNLFNPLLRGTPPAGGARMDLLASGEDAWEDLPDAQGENDFARDPEREPSGSFSLAMTSVFPPKTVGPMPEIAGTVRERPESRVLAFGGADVFANTIFEFNRDLLLNSFNWAAGREYRVNISPRDPDLRRMDVQRGHALRTVNLIVTIGLPALCLCLGLFTAWRRRVYGA